MSKASKSGAVFCALIVFCCLLVLPAKRANAEAFVSQEGNYPSMSKAQLDELVKKEGAGKIVLVSFFASWCPPCREEIPQLKKTRAKIDPEKLLIIAVSADEEVSDLHEFVQKNDVNFPVYLGTADIFNFYNVSAIPNMLVIGKDGKRLGQVEGLMREDDFNQMLSELLAE